MLSFPSNIAYTNTNINTLVIFFFRRHRQRLRSHCSASFSTASLPTKDTGWTTQLTSIYSTCKYIQDASTKVEETQFSLVRKERESSPFIIIIKIILIMIIINNNNNNNCQEGERKSRAFDREVF